MSALEKHLNTLPDYAKDLRVGLDGLLNSAAESGLTPAQLWGSAVAIAMTLRHHDLLAAVREDAAAHLDEVGLKAAHTAAAMMGMTNVYYHTTYHIMKDDDYRNMPAGLRMNAVKGHGYDQASFDLFALGASVIGQCSSCINAHDRDAKNAGISKQAIHTVVRLASYLNAIAIALDSK